MMLRDRIVRQRGAAGSGPYGGGDIDWTNPAEVPYPAEVYNPTSFENLDIGDEIVTRLICQTYPDADVTGLDRIVWRGKTYEITSDVEPLSMHGKVRGLRFVIQRVQGG